jgi:hypothetical protein
MMRTTPRRFLAATGVVTMLAAGLAGCGDTKSTSSGTTAAQNTKVGVLLPDTASSPRWVSADPNEINKQCIANKLTCYVDNANGSATTQQAQAQALINAGVGVLLVTNLDPGSGKAIEALAKQHNVVTIDYDRLTTGGTASYYVSYDNVKVGADQGTALTQAPQVKGKTAVNYVEIDGAPTDNNATLFAQGYNSVLSKQPGWKKLGEVTALVGDNGAGKSTLVKCVSGIYTHRRRRVSPSTAQPGRHPQPARRGRTSASRSSTRTSRSATTSTSSRTCSSAARSPRLGPRRADHGADGRRDPGQPLGPHRQVGAPARRQPLRRPAPDRGDRQGRALEQPRSSSSTSRPPPSASRRPPRCSTWSAGSPTTASASC